MKPLKPRLAMEEFRCQVGMRPATRTGNGALWLLPLPAGTPEDPPWDWAEGVTTTEPPVCLAHALVAAQKCPRLGERRHQAFFVRDAELVAVEGHLYPTPPSPPWARPQKAAVAWDFPEARLMVVERLVRRLRDVTPVDLDDRELTGDAVPCNRGRQRDRYGRGARAAGQPDAAQRLADLVVNRVGVVPWHRAGTYGRR
ncbi:hypothetical protein GCM10010393_15620 [Streptomyces gobitricini]|uniref:Uncharacterized protein n=2 Tax=Streptomyces gobitricini TaxID=68211 RepID=A0ABP5YVV3_9ACTN